MILALISTFLISFASINSAQLSTGLSWMFSVENDDSMIYSDIFYSIDTDDFSMMLSQTDDFSADDFSVTDDLSYSSSTDDFSAFSFSTDDFSITDDIIYSSPTDDFSAFSMSTDDFSITDDIIYSSPTDDFSAFSLSTDDFSITDDIVYSSPTDDFSAFSLSTDDFSVTDDIIYSSPTDDFSAFSMSTDDFSITDDTPYSSPTDDFSAFSMSTDDFSITDDIIYSSPTDDFSAFSLSTDDFSSITDDGSYSTDDFSDTNDDISLGYSQTDDGPDTASPTVAPTFSPTFSPTAVPSVAPTSAPSVAPTSAPTSAPTDVPTLSPTAFPTYAPTDVPSVVPTFAPTTMPSLTPTSSPSFNPTTIYETLKPNERTATCMADCTYPGMTIPPAEWGEEEFCAFYEQSTTCTEAGVSSYTCVPSCLTDCSDVFCETMSTLVFACNASSDGTYEDKNDVELECLTSFANSSTTRTEMAFATTTSFDGVGPTEMNTNASKQAAIYAMASSMPGVTTDQIKITNITGTDSRRLSSTSTTSHIRNGHGIHTLAASSTVTYQINVILELLGYDANSFDAAYDSLVGEITSSVTSGQFQQNLKVAGQQLNITTYQNVAVAPTVIFTEPELNYITTGIPSTPPTSSPTSRKKQSNEDDDGDIAAIAGGTIGGFFGLLLLLCIIYYCFNRQKRAELEERFKSHQLFKANEERLSEPGAYEEKTDASRGKAAAAPAQARPPAFSGDEDEDNNFL